LKEDSKDAGGGVDSFLQTLGKVLMVVLVVPPMLNYAGLQREKEFLSQSTEGQMYDVGFGQKLYLHCVGEGLPTVILDSATGHSSDSLAMAQADLASLTRVCVYDRAGLGQSETAPLLNMSDPGEGAVARTLGQESTVLRMVTDLHRLVTFSAPQPRPLVLVGTELGALVARLYTHLHPQDVAHLVLLDPLSETLFDPVHNMNDAEHTDNPWISYWFGHLLLSCRLLQVSAMTGLSRLALLTGLMKTDSVLPKDQTVESPSIQDVRQKHSLCNPWALQAVLDEHAALNVSLGQVGEVETAWPMPTNLTTTVISGSFYDEQLPPGLNRVWSRAVQRLIEKLGSRHHVITGADRHSILRPPLVQEALAPVRRIIRAWRVDKSQT